MVARIDDPMVLAQQLLAAVLGDGAELVIHIGDAPFGVRDRHDGVLVQGPLEVLQLPQHPAQAGRVLSGTRTKPLT